MAWGNGKRTGPVDPSTAVVITAPLTAALLVAAAAAAALDANGRSVTNAQPSDSPRRTVATQALSPSAEEGLDEDESAIRPIFAEYDRLYASIVADRAVLYDQPDHPLHHQIDELLTPDSPLRPTSIPDAARRFLADPTAVRAVRASVRALGLDGHGRRGDLEMRHSAASLFSADDGVPLECVTDALGHDGTRMVVRVYRHAVPPTVDAAVAPMERRLGADVPFGSPMCRSAGRTRK